MAKKGKNSTLRQRKVSQGDSNKASNSEAKNDNASPSNEVDKDSSDFLNSEAKNPILPLALAAILIPILSVLAWVFLPINLKKDSTKIVELDHHNFYSTLKQSLYTCVLFYDANDDLNTPRHQTVLKGMQEISANYNNSNNSNTIAFAQMNMKQHKLIHKIYNKGNVVDRLANEYYWEMSAPTDFLINLPSTFLNFEVGMVYLPAKLMVFTNEFNLQDSKDLTMLNTVSTTLQSIHLERWLNQVIQDKKEPQKLSPPNQERVRDEKYQQYKNNTFDFETYIEVKGVDEEFEAMFAFDKDEIDLWPLLEVGAKRQHKKPKIAPFVHRNVAVQKNKQRKSKSSYMQLGDMLFKYLGYVEGYESSWSEERKRREDEATNFGHHLEMLNTELKALIDKVLNKSRKEEVPNLKAFLMDMVFGMGRSPSKFRETLDAMAFTMGGTARERRQNRHKFNGNEFPILVRSREWMELYNDVHVDEYRYSVVLEELAVGWYSCLREFHFKLSKSYWNYLKDRSRVNKNEFQRKPMDTLDMTSPGDYDILTNYDAFHQKYTEKGTPVVLSNVKMFDEQLTVERIAELCPSADVTRQVHSSPRVAEEAAPQVWGGLLDFKLDDLLLNEKRQATEIHKDDNDEEEALGGENGTDNKDEEEPLLGEFGQTLDKDGIDRSITFEQFAMLYKNLPDVLLYLHDWGLQEDCDRLLYNETIYEPHQKFRIPSVIGSYDLFQRVQYSSFEKSWPSLFVGRKGSNSKLHVDSGATGFFMYLVSGRKRWVTYNRDERPFLYQDLEVDYFVADVLAMGTSTEADNFLSKRFPLLHRAEAAYETIQEPGQLVYIPPNVPHAVGK